MSCSCPYITDLASSIHKSIGEPSAVSISFIAGKLTSNAFLGQLNTLLYKCHSIVDGCIEPPLDVDEQAIYATLYEADYYKKQISSYIGAAGVKRVLSVKEGDSSVSLSNTASEAKVIADLAKSLRQQANEMADLYNRGRATALGVSFYTIDQYGPSSSLINDQFSPRI
jgi:hypothetical protein